jgi:hypothetical protein
MRSPKDRRGRPIEVFVREHDLSLIVIANMLQRQRNVRTRIVQVRRPSVGKEYKIFKDNSRSQFLANSFQYKFIEFREVSEWDDAASLHRLRR